MIKTVITDKAPKALGHYVQGTIANGFVHTAMQLPINLDNPDEGVLDIKSQTEQVLKNVLAIIDAAGANKSMIVQMPIYLTDIKDWDIANEIYTNMMGKSQPARSVIMVAGLHKGYNIAVEGVAAL